MKILVVRLRLIGDVVFTTPLLRGLRRRYPEAHIAYVVEPAAAPVVQGNPHLNEVIVAPRARGLARITADISLARRLRRGRFDIAIDLHGGPRSAWLTWSSGAPMRIGYTIPGREWMYTHRVERSPDLAPRHSVLTQWDLLGPLGIEACDPSRDAVEMMADSTVSARLDHRLRAVDIRPEHRVIVIHVSAGNAFRRWPPESFRDVVVALVRRDPCRRVILTAGPSDRDAARSIGDAARRKLGPLASSVPDIGELDLPELRALMARTAVYIGGDSGPLHIAATTTVPIVELLGPTLPERSRPWRDARWYSETLDVGALPCRPCRQRHCVPGDYRCLTGITAERVTEAAERAMTFEAHV